MSNGGSLPPNDIFDVKRVRRLVELMKEHDLSELDLKDGEQRVRLRRGAEPMVSYPVSYSAPRQRLLPVLQLLAAAARLRRQPPQRKAASLSRARWSARSIFRRIQNRHRSSRLAITSVPKQRSASSKR